MSERGTGNDHNVIRHLVIGVSSHVLAIGFFTLGEKLGGLLTPNERTVPVISGVVLLLSSLALCEVVIRFIIKSKWGMVRDIWYYVLPLALFFWPYDMRLEIRAQREVIDKQQLILEKLIRTGLQAQLIAWQALSPDDKKEALSSISSEMRGWTDPQRAVVASALHNHMSEIARSDDESLSLLEQAFASLASIPPDQSPGTWRVIFYMLEDVYANSGNYPLRFRQDLVKHVKAACMAVDPNGVNFVHLQGVVDKLMHEPDENIAADLLYGVDDQRCPAPVRNRVFAAAVNRALRLPSQFGWRLLQFLEQMKERVFWLDLPVLQQLVMSANGNGVITQNPTAFSSLCKGVFCPLANSNHREQHHGRVFRRLVGDAGKMRVICDLGQEKMCTCEAKSLSFRGLYSEKCTLSPNCARVAMKLATLTGDKAFSFRGTAAKLHDGHKDERIPGRGIFFGDGEESSVKDLYEYIASP